MNGTEDLLRRAVLDFTSRLAEIIRLEVSSEVRAQLARTHVAPLPVERDAEPPAKPHRETPLQRIVAFVTAHPGATPKDIVAELRIARPTVFKALAEGCAASTFGKRGGGRTVQYFVGSLPAEPAIDAAQPAAAERAPTGAWRRIAEQVVAFVQAHPGCRYGAIQDAVGATTGILQRALRDAKEHGAIRMEGTRIKARYFATGGAAEPPAPTAPSAPELPPLPDEDREQAEAMLQELDANLANEMDAVRLTAVLQAIVAHARWLQERIGRGDPLAPRLEYALRRITAVRAEKELPPLTGLKRGATADWLGVVRRARARVDEFDRDLGEAPNAPPPTASFPTLQHAVANRPLVLVGGTTKNDILFQIERRYGLSVEWTAAPGDDEHASDAFVERVRHGTLGAVVILEGLFDPAQVARIVQALKAHDVPHAYGDRAATESLHRAFYELEETFLHRQTNAG